MSDNRSQGRGITTNTGATSKYIPSRDEQKESHDSLKETIDKLKAEISSLETEISLLRNQISENKDLRNSSKDDPDSPILVEDPGRKPLTAKPYPRKRNTSDE